MATWTTRPAVRESQMAATGDMSVVERLKYLLDTGQFADVNIRVGQGTSATVFKAHRLLLATASQALYRLVYQVCPSPGPNDVTTIRVTDMTPQDFEYILKYIYTDQIDCKNINVAFELLRASRKWGLAGLGIKSLTYLEEFVDNFEPTNDEKKTNLFDLLVLSEETLNEMSEKCWQILTKNANAIIPCEGFLNLNQPMVKKVICHKDIKFENQLKLFEAIRDWGLRYIEKHNLKLMQLGTVVEELIKVVDFDSISDADFINTVLSSECLGKAEVIAFFMTHGLEIPRNLDFNNNKQLCSLTQNGSLLEFRKVCRFRKGYRCPQKEIYQEHEIRFRVDKNIRLLGVGFGFLFSCTDMGINVHCQGPWETRQWSDITQSYCRVSGEKQETADVRLMFLHPVRIVANQSYKVVVKTVRMSAGSSEVELWGGTGGLYCVEMEDAEFHFIKAAVDPSKSVEESDGDTTPSIITELLYQMDTGEEDPPAATSTTHRRHTQEDQCEGTSQRRRRPQEQDQETQPEVQTNPWRRRQRPEVSLKVRKRSPPADDQKTPEAPPPCRRRESNDFSSRRASTEEYKPESFSTNRWRTRTKDTTEPEYKKSPVEEYKPTSFSTNRWLTRPKTDKSDSDGSSYISQKKTEEYKPESFSTNRWRTRSREEETSTKKTIDSTPYSSRKTSTESTQETNRWQTSLREEPKDTPFGARRFSRSGDNSASSHPFMRRRESKDTVSEVPFFLRPRPSQSEETKTTAGSALGRSRLAATTTIPAKEDKPTETTTTRSRFLKSTEGIGSSSLRSSASDSLSSRYGTTRDSSLSRTRETSLSRYGGSTRSSYLSSRYDPSTPAGGSESSSTSSISSRYSSLLAPPGGFISAGSGVSSRYGDSSATSSGISGSSRRYSSSSADTAGMGRSVGSSSRYTSPAPARRSIRYGSSPTGSAGSLAALSRRYSVSAATGSGSTSSGSTASRFSTSGSLGSNAASSSSGSRLGSLSSASGSGLYGLATSTGGSGSTSSSRYSSSDRYGSPGPSSGSGRYGSPGPSSGSGRYGYHGPSSGSGRYESPGPSSGSGRNESPGPSSGSGRYESPGPSSGSGRYGLPDRAGSSTGSYSGRYGLSSSAGDSGTTLNTKYGTYASTGRYSSPVPSGSSSRTSTSGLGTSYSSQTSSGVGIRIGSGSTLSGLDSRYLSSSTGIGECDMCPNGETSRYTTARGTSPSTISASSRYSTTDKRRTSDGGSGKVDNDRVS